MSRTRVSLVMGLLLVGLSSCECGPPTRVEATYHGVDVVVDSDEGRVQLARAGRVLLDVPAPSVGTRTATPFYDMQFGMFDIQEDATPYTFAASLQIELDDSAAGHIFVHFLDQAGAPLVDMTLSASEQAGEAVEISLKALAPEKNQLTFTSACSFEHAIGFGGQTHDVDHVGQRVPLWVSEPGIGKNDDDELPVVWQVVGRRHTSSAPIPAFVADNAAAYVVDATAFTRVDLCATDEATAGFEAWQNELKVYVYAGDTPREAQAKMVDALGRPPLPPPWTFAPWNDAIFGSQAVRDYGQRLRDEGIPSSALWTEDFRGGGPAGGGQYRLDEDWGVDPVMYADFDDMVADMRAQGFQSLTYYNTFVVTDADIFDEATTNGYTILDDTGAPYLFAGADKDFKPTGLLDLTNPDAREFIKGFMRQSLASGVRGWMADFAEWQPVEDAFMTSGEDPALVHNLYPVRWQQLNREVLEEEGHLGGDDGAVTFVRSAWLGSQSQAQVIWAGDQRTSFDDDDGLPTILPMGIGLSAVGFPFYTHDVAGYQSATNDPVDKELFLRWTTLGALSAVMRTHHGTHVELNVNVFTDEETTAHWKRWAELHIRLYPYLRRLAVDATSPGGLPLWVPMPLLYPADEPSWSLLDQVFLGPSILVAPVVEKGALSRSISFPAGRFVAFTPAFDPADNAVVEGPAAVEVDAPLTEIPLYVPAGGIIPLTAEPADTLMADIPGLDGLESTEGDRVVFVALGADGSFVEESGASYTLEGTGTTPPAGEVTLTGNDVVTGDGFTLTLAGHPATRTTVVIFR